jgi:esterase/lipase superfamily enzyme
MTEISAVPAYNPNSHKFGSVGSPWWKRWIKLEDDRLKLVAIDPSSESDFWRLVKEELFLWDEHEKQALVYLHGFNVTFEEAAIRAAQIGFDLKKQGVMAFFSWPSRGMVQEYPADAAVIEASEVAITEFLVRFARDVGARRVDIIAHSMGNRGLLRAMQRIQNDVQRQSRVKFGQIFLAAPDVDADLFRQLSMAYMELSSRTTLYVSPADKAVGLSQWLYDSPRAGFTPPITVVPGIDTVEVPDFDIDILGHSYYSEAEGILHDMFDLLRRNAPPDDRQRLHAVRPLDGLHYWKIR